jgi:hypothetical protein
MFNGSPLCRMRYLDFCFTRPVFSVLWCNCSVTIFGSRLVMIAVFFRSVVFTTFVFITLAMLPKRQENNRPRLMPVRYVE